MLGVAALIVAAGRGHRVGASIPKQYLDLRGRPVLHHTLRALGSHRRIDLLQVAIHPDDMALYAASITGLPDAIAKKLLPPVHGGARRQDSVRLGLENLNAQAPALVLIHDGARPLVSGAIIDRTIEALAKNDGAIAALRVTDTLKREGVQGQIATTLDRQGLWRAQTPQGFRFEAILRAHRAAAEGPELTDDAQVAERNGLTVVLVEGEEANLKITTPEDLRRAASALAKPDEKSAMTTLEPRTGTGFDVHRFGPGDHVMLCGVRVPHEAGVLAHSDGDVGLHALVDAVLGALGAGDIGSHFPPSDPKWRNADSALFVRHAAGLARQRGATITHVDITMICERPKIGPHRAAMIERIADLLGVTPDRVSVKATTTEQLGFTGRREGLAAQAIATLLLPPASRS
ncbi:MAG: bifunctional 2-C-methyl-D-erythritol 4-phosphate cytidylyltransferase/2-C-methyl-D-erythritol 2,4-cyclodiphosphate synthase [Alphaproteobacteria bacterium]|nr:bifunctional 2-C-methyl-D-erythritol 4-phosphate cytidylyltransferase/2-C-methyl-D-erythritol 2,4-cyclodiphosphate synthase [Alphaproteobacteria bacterium]